MQKKNNNVRLSPYVVPTEYEIQLRPDLANFTFEGIEIISMSLSKPTKTLSLHSKDLQIETAEVILGKDKVFADISYNEKNETVVFDFPKSIPKGQLKLTLVFKGILNDQMRGFYRSTYQIEGKTNHIATTQFESTDARRAFPCFDEPAQKAVFHVSLIIPKGKTAISNTLPVSAIEHESGFEIIRFAPTPKMSTYLLAFIIGDFEYLEQKSSRGVLVRVYTTPGKKHQAKFALDVTVRVLEFYEKYFDIPYPLKTLDMIAIPDFASLAMENWGAITFREVGLLVDEKNTSVGSKELIAEVIAHELAHQWFGNLVTMEWWTHLWLNEGFASYVPYIVLDKLFPEWNLWERFNTQTLGVALHLDGLANTHPIEITVHHPDEIGEIFDAVSYSKGASVIRMLADYLGEVKFRDGLRYYLKKHSYKNTETIHLWQAFEKVSKKKVSTVMKNWTGFGGYPVVQASINSKNNLELEQSRFFASPISRNKVKNKTIWDIPITLGNNTKKNEVMLSKKKTVLSSVDSWVKVNLGESGFFRTTYSDELLERLVEPVQNKTLSPVDRLGIIRDLFALSEAGIVPTTDALHFLQAYRNEDNYSVWVEIAVGLARIEQIIAKRPHQTQQDKTTKEKLDIFIIELFSPLLKNLTWESRQGEANTDSLLRSMVISRLGRSGDEKVIKKAINLTQVIQKGQHINPDIRSAIYNVVASVGSMKEYKAFINQYKEETLHEEKNRIGNALGYFADQKILFMVCDFAMSKEVRNQDTVGIISSVGISIHGRDVWWNFVKTNWETLVTRYGDGGHTLSRLIKAISGSAESKHLIEFKKFFKTNKAPGAKRAIEQVKEKLASNNAWLKRDGKNIDKFLRSMLD